MFGLQGGAALAAGLFPVVGAGGVVLVRLSLAALLLWTLWRPGVRWERRSLGPVVIAGSLLAVHHLSYYEAVSRIPLGQATTVEFLGPFMIALVTSRRLVSMLWAVLALTGVILLATGGTSADLLGLLFAAVAGGCWASYILVSARLARSAGAGRRLALAVTWAALLSLPFGIAQGGSRLLTPHVLLLGLGVAVLSSILPYTFNMEALRRLPPRVFGVLTSLEPAVGALVGWLILSQRLSMSQCLGIAAVALAAIGSTRATTDRTAAPPLASSTPPPDTNRNDHHDGFKRLVD